MRQEIYQIFLSYQLLIIQIWKNQIQQLLRTWNLRVISNVNIFKEVSFWNKAVDIWRLVASILMRICSFLEEFISSIIFGMLFIRIYMLLSMSIFSRPIMISTVLTSTLTILFTTVFPILIWWSRMTLLILVRISTISITVGIISPIVIRLVWLVLFLPHRFSKTIHLVYLVVGIYRLRNWTHSTQHPR